MPKPSTVADIFEQLRTHGTVPWQDEDKPAEEDKMQRHPYTESIAHRNAEIKDTQKYTVLMIVPEYLAENYGEDTYLAYVNAENVEEAQQVAQVEALISLVGEEGIDDDVGTPDFLVCFVCEGHMADIHIW